jgi:hypothetical protein
MTRQYLCSAVLALALIAPIHARQADAGQQAPAAAAMTFSLAEPVLAGGSTLMPGTYQIRFAATAGENTGIAQRDVELLRDGQVVARETAEIVPAAETAGTTGSASRVRVEKLKGGEFVRVSFVDGSDRYLVHLPTTTLPEH